jgi:hypothetical protein
MRSLLFHRLLSSHPALLAPEGSSRLHFRFFTARLHFRFFTASLTFACADKLGSLFFPDGPTFRRCKIHVMLRAVSLLPFLKEVQRFSTPVAQRHWLPATWRPDPYHGPDLHRQADDNFAGRTSAGKWARHDDRDGIREVHCNTCEGAGASLRAYLRAFRGVHRPIYISMSQPTRPW